MIKLAESQLLSVDQSSPYYPFKLTPTSKTGARRQKEGKENVVNYEVMKMETRTEKPFEKIPNYNVN